MNEEQEAALKSTTNETPPWHAWAADKVVATLSTSHEGLAEEEAKKRLAQYGENVLPTRKAPTLLGIFFHQFKSPLIYILLAAAAVALALAEYTDAGFVFLVLALNATLGTIQEWNAERSAAALQNLLTINARVRRSDQVRSVSAQHLVPGDIVLLESGDRVPADLRLLRVNHLSVDESFLTGENIPPVKHVDAHEEQTGIADRLNIAFAGSMVMSGRGLGVVVSTGVDTQVGQIASSVAFAEPTKPPLILRMEKLAHQISYFVGAAVVALGVIGLVKGIPPVEVFFLVVALAVAAIPEGLPVAMTVALSIAVRRMAQRNVIVRKLPAVEGLGSCTCIASDKTGTLTVNQQTVKALTLLGVPRLSVSGEGLAPKGKVLPSTTATSSVDTLAKPQEALLQRFARAGAICNEGALEQDAEGVWHARGDAMDVALLSFAHKAGVDPDALWTEAGKSSGKALEPIADIPYESEQKYAARFYREDGHPRVAIKGALETVLGFCDRMQTSDGTQALDRAHIEREALALASEGYRVLAIAESALPKGHRFLGPTPDKENEGPLTAKNDGTAYTASETDLPPLALLGLAGFMDPLRPEAKASVASCQAAGIRVIMITGDHPATAYAIANELGIAASKDEVVNGASFAKVADDSEAQKTMVERARVFARVSPLQKLEIVDALMKVGHFVAVTGDGVNDAPALKKANVGIAMGSGTEVAKDTASLVITDDNFASIEAGVEEGRFAYDNVRKVTYLLISCGLAEVLLFTASLLTGLPLPLTAVQLLWLNLVTNGIQDVALAFEGGDPSVMKRPPRKPSEGVFNRLMLQQVATSGIMMATLAFGAWYVLLEMGLSVEAARSDILLLMVLCQNVHVMNVRSEYLSAFRVPIHRNYVLFFGVLAAQGLHLVCMNVPFTQKVLEIVPTKPIEWLAMFGLSLVMLVTMEAFKVVRNLAGAPKNTEALAT